MSENSNYESLFTEIKKITDEAIAPHHTKKTAKPFVKQLERIEYRLPEKPELRHIFSEFVCYVLAASGQGRNKQQYLDRVSQDLVLIEWELKAIAKNSTHLIPHS